jgi:uncharacterized membrane protein
MDEQPMQQVPPPPASTGWQQTPPPPPNYQAAAVPAEGLSDTAAGALAYVTIIPAIIFLVMAPYNTKPFVRFHAFQSIGFYIVWFCACFVIWIPFLGWALGLALLVCLILCIVKASQGSVFKLPIISGFAAKQSGYQP